MMSYLNFRTMKHTITYLLPFYFLFCTSLLLSAQNEDTPNLSFEQGTFAGWELYFGEHYLDDAGNTTVPYLPNGTDTYKTVWNPAERNSLGRRIVVKPMRTNEADSTIACNNPPFWVNPPGMPFVARIGEPTKTEGLDKPGVAMGCNANNWNRGKYATGEKMTYTFIVTPRTTLLTYKFAAVLHVPTGDDHTGEELPVYKVDVMIEDTVSGDKPVLPCAGYDLSANLNAPGIERNKSTAECPVSLRKANNVNANEYIFQNWTAGSIDLSMHIGKKVTIEVETHDCLYAGNAGCVVAGNHAAYGYFWAETRELKLDVQNCVGEDAVLTAPEGFASYKWMCDGIQITPGEDPRIAVIPMSQINQTATYSCELENDCGLITLKTQLAPVQIVPDFTYQNECGGSIHFTNKSSVMGNDSIQFYSWDFGDGSVSGKKDTVHVYPESGSYDVKLEVTSSMGCKNEITLPVSVNPFPSKDISGNRSICEGDTVRLSVEEVETGYTFLWNTGSDKQSIEETPESSREYNVKIFDTKNTCEYTKKVDVAVYMVPVLTIEGNTKVCPDDTVRLKVTGGANEYRWSIPGQNTEEVKFVPLEDGTVSVTGIYSAIGCNATVSTEIKINPLPDVSIEGPNEICRNTLASFTATGAVNYDWFDNFMGSVRMINPQNDTILKITGIDGNGCQSIFEKHIKVKDIPELACDPVDPVCEGSILSILISGEGGITYDWGDGIEETGSFYSTKATNPGDNIYSVTGTKNGCSAKLDIPVHVLPAPKVLVIGKDRICAGDSTDLTAKGADSYTWIPSGKTTDKITAFGSMQVIGMAANGCSSEYTHHVTVLPKPVILITGDKIVCENTHATLVAQGGVSHIWNTGDYALISDTLRPLIGVGDFTFTVVGTDDNSCQNTNTFTVSSVPLPGLSFTGSPEVCLGETLALIGQGATSYKWSDGSTSPLYEDKPTSSGMVTMTGTVANCTSSLDIPIQVLIPPTLFITGDSAVCKGAEFTLWANGTGSGSYEWDTGDKTDFISYRLNENTIFKVRGTDANTGCVSEVKAEVKLFPVADVKIKQEDIFSCPSQPDTVILTASGGVKYQWSSIPYNGGINDRASERLRFEIEENTQVFVEGESQYGCFSSDTFMVNRLVHPPFVFSVDPNVIEAGSTTVRFKGLSPDDYRWYWTPGESAIERQGDNITHSFSVFDMVADSIRVTVRNVNGRGCGYEGEEWVYVWRDFWSPDAFSPNGDKLNDTFHFMVEDYIYNFSYTIFNRLGEIVFTGKSPTDEWDGTRDGQPCPWGVYGWVVKYKSDYKGVQKEGEKNGFVTLVR
jgi:gliding motility-associated-like protein